MQSQTEVKEALDHVRTATQQLHGAISDAVAKRGGALKADLAAVPQRAKAVSDILKGSMRSQNEAAKKDLSEAITFLEETQKHASEGVQSSGKAFQASVRQTLADARAAAQKVSEAVAATRTPESQKRSR